MPELSNPSPSALHVLIVGGGLCGLATAIALILSGHKVTIFEASDRVHAFGSGLQCSPNGTRLLSRWGLEEILKPVATSPKVLQIHSVDGALLARRKNFDQDVDNKYGAPLSTFHRVDLQAGLLRRARELGAKIHYSSRVTGLDSSGPGVRLVSGEIYSGDLVVVADGTSSILRSDLLGMTVNPQPTHDIAYRITIDRERVYDKELLALVEEPQMRVWVGPGSYAIGYPVRDGKQFSVLLIIADDSYQGNSTPHAIIEELRVRLVDWDPVLLAMLDAVVRISKWRIMKVPPLPSCISPQGTCVLAGDSCRSMHPFLGQGLSMALEDGAALGSLLSNVTSPMDLPKATTLYNRLRTSRAMRMLEETDLYRENLHLANGALQMVRDGEIAKSLESENDWAYLKAQDWIWSYDAYKEAEAAYLGQPY